MLTASRLLLILTLLTLQNAYGQVYDFAQLTNVKDLPSSETYDIYQSKNGFIWIASDQGVIRFDGYETTLINSKKGLPDPVVFSFYEDSVGAIWFRSLSGKIAFLQNNKITLYPHSHELEKLVNKNFLYSFLPYEGKLYFSNSQLIGYIDENGKTIAEPIASTQFVIRSVNERDFVYGFAGISTFIREIVLDHKHYPIQLSDTITYNKVIRTIKIKEDLFISINNDVFKINGGRCEKIFTGRKSIIGLTADKSGNIWVGYLNEGADRLTLKNGRVVKHEIMFTTKSVTAAHEDDEGGIWISTLESGVFYIENSGFQFKALKFKPLASLYANGNMIIGDQTGTLTVYEFPSFKEKWSHQTTQPIRSIFLDENQNIWTGSNHTYRIGLKDHVVHDTFDPSFASIKGDSIGIVGIGGSRLIRIHPKTYQKQQSPVDAIHRIILPVKHQVLLARRLGLDVYTRDGKFIQSIKALEDQKISHLEPINKDVVAIGTIGGGLFALDIQNLKCINLSTKTNFAINYVYTMARNDSLLYLSTEKGIIATKISSIIHRNPESLFVNIRKKYDLEQFRSFHFTKNQLIAIKDDGVVWINLPDWSNVIRQPRFYHEVADTSGTLPNAGKLSIKFNTPLKVRFGFISFKNQNIATRYRLSESSPWTKLTSREVDLNAIATGNHRLELQSSLDGKTWTTQLTLPISVQPPWWKSWYIILYLILLSFIISFIIVRVRIRRLKEKEALLNVIDDQRKKLIQSELETIERERTRIAKDLHDGVGTDLAAIKISVHQIIEKADPQLAEEINTYFQDTIKEIRFIIQDLAPPSIIEFGLKSSIQNYCEKVKAKFKIAFRFEWTGNEVKDSQRGNIVFRIIQELVTNSIKHSHCSQIDLKIDSYPDLIVIHYADDGIGFEMSNNFDGLGLKNIKSRVEFLNGSLHFNSSEHRTSFEIQIPHS